MASIPNNRYPHERPLGEVLNDLKVELKDFISVRVQMLKSEMNEKLGTLKTAAPMLAIGAVLAITAFILFSLALVFLIAMAFQGQSYQWTLAFAIVAAVYGLAGAVCIGFGYSSITAKGLKPERTLRVLKQDQVWVQSEARSEL